MDAIGEGSGFPGVCEIFAKNRRRSFRVAPEENDHATAGPPRTTQSPARDSICNMTALRKATRRLSLLYEFAAGEVRAPFHAALDPRHRREAGNADDERTGGALVLDRSALAHNLKPLEREGLVTVVANERDRRSQ